MADWFKFYENDLDETRLQYAIAKLPEVVSVWVGILSVCCQDKSRTIRWGENEIELFGFSRRLGISIPKVNEAVRLLCEIDYMVLKDGKITVKQWDSKQSEYCRKRPRVTRKTPNKLPIVSGHTADILPLEERRGEEIRKEENISLTSTLKPNTFKKPDFSELELYAAKLGFPALEINKFYDHYEANGWRVGRNPMRSWQAAMRNWKNNLQTYGSTTNRPNTAPNPRNAGIATDGSDYGNLVALKIQRQNAQRNGGVEAKLAGQTPELGIAPP